MLLLVQLTESAPIFRKWGRSTGWFHFAHEFGQSRRCIMNDVFVQWHSSWNRRYTLKNEMCCNSDNWCPIAR
eukprot:2858047-Pyramimonas_sp.AAC.1